MNYIDLATEAFNKYKKIVKANEKSDKVFGSKLKDSGFDVKVNSSSSVLTFFKPQNKVLIFSKEYAKQTFYRYKIHEYKTLLKEYADRLNRPQYTFYATAKPNENILLKNMAEKYVHALSNIEKVYSNKNDSAEFDEVVYEFVHRVKRNVYVQDFETSKDKIEQRVTNIVSVNEANQNLANEIIAYTAGGRYLVKPDAEKEVGMNK